MKKKILFVARKMSVGGIESSLVNLLNYINNKHEEEFEVTLFTFNGGILMEEIPQNVNVKIADGGLKLISSSFGEILRTKNPVKIIKRIYYTLYASVYGSDTLYKKLFKKHSSDEKYDVAISYYNDITTVRFSRGTNMFVSEYVNADKKVAWIHTDPELCRFDRNYCLKLYENFDKIFCVSKAVKDKFNILLPEYSNKTEVLYNKFNEKDILKKSERFIPFKKGNCDIVTVGRIDNDTKRIDMIVKICARLKDEGITNFRWRVIGGGNDLKNNITLARKLNVLDVLEFKGEKSNPYPYIKNSDVFALCSAYEGYPMVIGEAKTLETFIITAKYAAAYEQIEEGQGIICSDDEVFYQSIKTFISKNN